MKKLFVLSTSLLLALLMVSACVPTPVSQDASLTQIAQAAHGTMTAVAEGTAVNPAEATPAAPVVVVTQLVYVTATPVPGSVVVTPAPVSGGQGNRLSMALGATNLNVTGKVLAGQTVRYVFGAMKGQLIDLNISTGGDAVLGVSNRAGTVLLERSKQWTYFRTYLPAGGDWYIDVYGGKQDSEFSLFLSIPARLAFAAGASTLTGKGTLGGGRSMSFILYAREGQTLKASVGNGYGISVYAVEGTVLQSPMGGSSSFEGKLPLTGDYIIDVFSAPETAPRAFNLNVEVK